VKLLWLALDRASVKWTMQIRRWDMAPLQSAIHFPGRLAL
jgi:transposase-like protein